MFLEEIINREMALEARSFQICKRPTLRSLWTSSFLLHFLYEANKNILLGVFIPHVQRQQFWSFPLVLTRTIFSVLAFYFCVWFVRVRSGNWETISTPCPPSFHFRSAQASREDFDGAFCSQAQRKVSLANAVPNGLRSSKNYHHYFLRSIRSLSCHSVPR